jgi:hypothetical protein
MFVEFPFGVQHADEVFEPLFDVHVSLTDTNPAIVLTDDAGFL